MLIATDSIPLSDGITGENVRIESVAKYFAEAIYTIQTGGSLSENKTLFP